MLFYIVFLEFYDPIRGSITKFTINHPNNLKPIESVRVSYHVSAYTLYVLYWIQNLCTNFQYESLRQSVIRNLWSYHVRFLKVFELLRRKTLDFSMAS